MIMETFDVSVGAQGFAEMAPLRLYPGITVLAGRNNVGKSRFLKEVASLRADSRGKAYTARVTEGDLTAVVTGAPTLHKTDFLNHGQIVWSSTMQPNPSWAGSESGQRSPDHDSRLSILNDSFLQLMYVPPIRSIASLVEAEHVIRPSADGHDLAQCLIYHLNNRSQEVSEMEDVMTQMFSEIGNILTIPQGNNHFQLTILDRYTDGRISFEESGTGVSQALLFVALVLFSLPGRIFLMDEPHVYLHPVAERILAKFFRDHPEHSYVVATHSPMLMNALEPDQLVHVQRDAAGTHLVLALGSNDRDFRQALFSDLGVVPSDFAWCSRVLLVEGSDYVTYPILFRRLGWDVDALGCGIAPLPGAGTTTPMKDVVAHLERLLGIDFRFLLDGDQQGEYEDSHVLYLPVAELENVLLRDAAAVKTGLVDENPLLPGDERARLAEVIDVHRIESFINGRDGIKGSKILTDLAHELGVVYKKSIHNPIIASALSSDYLTDLRDQLAPFVASADQTSD